MSMPTFALSPRTLDKYQFLLEHYTVTDGPFTTATLCDIVTDIKIDADVGSRFPNCSNSDVEQITKNLDSSTIAETLSEN